MYRTYVQVLISDGETTSMGKVLLGDDQPGVPLTQYIIDFEDLPSIEARRASEGRNGWPAK